MTGTAVQLSRRLSSLELPETLATDRSHSILWRWIASRALMLMLLVGLDYGVTGDVIYYGRALHTLFNGASVPNTLIEYPVPVFLVLLPQFLIGGLNSVAFAFLFAASMLAVDAAFTGLLWRVDGRRRSAAVNLWLWFVPCVGPLAYFRFDLVPAALAGAAVLVAARRPAVCAALTACGAALKLWPAIMLPTFLLRRDRRLTVVGSFVLTGAVFLGGSLLIGGVQRTLSPLRWQSDRGLQIESIAATPLMLARSVTDHVWLLRVSNYKAWEIFGAGVGATLVLTTVITALGVILLALLWLRAHRMPQTSALTLGWMLVATALVVTITNKTLSPQYILWLGGPVAGLTCLAPRDRAVRRIGQLLLVVAVLTHLVFPIGYGSLTSTDWTAVPATLLLAARNLLLVYLTWFACRQVWTATAREPARELTPDAAPSEAAA